MTAAVAILVVLICSAPASAQGFALRVNAGATSAYTDKAGNAWQADKSYNKGNGLWVCRRGYR